MPVSTEFHCQDRDVVSADDRTVSDILDSPSQVIRCRYQLNCIAKIATLFLSMINTHCVQDAVPVWNTETSKSYLCMVVKLNLCFLALAAVVWDILS